MKPVFNPFTGSLQLINTDGAPGAGIVVKGAYNAETDYTVGDSVDYQGSSYVMYIEAVAGTLPTDTTKWQVIANKGTDGTNGTNGIGITTQTIGFTLTGGTTPKTLTVALDANVAGTNTGDQDISGKVDVISGKGLSTNDYTTAEQTKLSGIATGAEVNVNADWNSSSGDSQISNKPTLGTSAAKNIPATGNASSTEVVYGSDTRLSDTRTPSSTLTHAATHVTGSTDVIASVIAAGNAGLMTGADKTKLDGIATGANVGVVPNGAITGAIKTKITYDTKGLITGGADATTADIADSTNKRYVTDANLTVIGNTSGTNTGNQDLSGYAPLASPSFTGTPTTPTAGAGDSTTQIASTAFVQQAVRSVPSKEACEYATIAALPTVVYSNGTAGVGATLTGVAMGAIGIDSNSPSVGQRILVKNQVSTFENGIYTVTATGSGIAVFVLTRSLDFNQTGDIVTGAATYIVGGTTLAGTTWDVNSADSPVIGTDAITFIQSAGPGSIIAGTGISISGVTIAINEAVTADLTTAQTLTNKTLTSPKINEAVALTSTSTELNVLDGIPATLTATELGYVDGVTSAIQTQLNAKAASLGADDNYVTDAQLVVIGNTSGTNTGNNAANSSTMYIGTTQHALNRASAVETLTGITLTTPIISVMTTTQKNAIETPTSGMMVYDSTLNKLCVYGVSSWGTIQSGYIPAGWGL